MLRTILVQISDHSWTKQALHLACSAARNNGCQVVLLYLSPIKNIGLLGTGIGATPPAQSDYEVIEEYAQTAEDYAVELILQPMTYESLDDALIQAVERLNSVLCFAHIPSGKWRWLHWIRLRRLKHQLERRGCQLSTLESSGAVGESLPGITLRPIR